MLCSGMGTAPSERVALSAANSDYINRLRMIIQHLHGCDSRHLESVPVHEQFLGETVWEGRVEVFEIIDHPRATRCFAWGNQPSRLETSHNFTAVLGIPPIDSPAEAVKAALAADSGKHLN